MATNKCKLLLVCVFILHSISFYVESSHASYIFEESYSIHSNIRHSRHHRLKRDVTSKTVERSILENNRADSNGFNPFLFSVRDEVTSPSTRLFVYSDSSIRDLFSVDADGNVNLATNKRLDYEDVSMRRIKLYVNATSRTDQSDVIILDITLLVQDINDENPVFKNQPHPYLATVSPNSRANIKVYELYAEDPDGSTITYSLLTGSESMFEIVENDIYSSALKRDIRVGDIRTKGGTFTKEEYSLVISATDTDKEEQTTTATVKVKVGERPPQFYETAYTGKIPEQSSANQFLDGELKIQAKSFQNKPVTYELFKGDTNSTHQSPYFTIDRNTGIVKTTNSLKPEDLDYDALPKPQRPQTYQLTAKATEAVTGQFSTIPLSVELTDNNDNSPIFEFSSYQRERLPEDFPLKETILTVKAEDDDSGTNAEIVYSVDHDHFYVDTVNDPIQGYIGNIKAKLRLDYDRLVGHMYSFTVTAYDKGSPANFGTAGVRVSVTNVNDEAPEIQIDNTTVFKVREDSEPDYVLTFLQAQDLDGDKVKFYFTPDQTVSAIFTIVPDTGQITLNAKVPNDADMYVLNITVVDDGSCCGGTTSLSSEAYIMVLIVDVNEHKPTFLKCSDYNTAMILEHQPIETPVIKVEATDDDRGLNGKVTYSILRSQTNSETRFTIGRDSGQILSAIKFDREIKQSYSVTVRGNDQAKPSLEGYCTFRVNIGDINDNSPIFDQPQYTANIEQETEVNSMVANVRAEDKDVGINAEIEYSMVNNAEGMFRIDEEGGIIYLDQPLTGAISSFSLLVMAKDKGIPPLNSTVVVTVKVANITSKPPSWNNYQDVIYNVSEVADYGFEVAKFSATSNVDNNPAVLFRLINSEGNSVTIMPPFFLSISGNTVSLKVQGQLDYTTKNYYELRLRVTNFNFIPSISEITPRIQVIDKNNKAPYFVGTSQSNSIYPGSVTENLAPGQTVIDVKAFDDDVIYPNNEITFSIVYKEDVSSLFAIQKVDNNTARITTTARFDREAVNFYFIQVQATDGKASDVPGHTPPDTPNTGVATVQIKVIDQNDNSPYFEKSNYNASVLESAGIRTSVKLVTAQDLDTSDVLTYSITSGNTRNAFGVQPKKGIIYVARQLDYESGETVYTLTIMASDGLHTNTTTLTIYVEDVNDNRPTFDQESYVITDVVEEDNTISPSTPRNLTIVRAVDGDKTRPNDITYSLLGSGTQPGEGQLFGIHPKSGQLYLLRPLDRDEPNGRATYQFNVRAMDEPQNPETAQYGFASVEVKPIDINDNQPIFTGPLSGTVDEHSPNGTNVFSVLARDYDFGNNSKVVYGIVEGPSGTDKNIKFAIDKDTGLIKTNAPSTELDREDVSVYTFKITAHDLGPDAQITTATVEITLNDINDQVPKFQQKIYNVSMSEFQTSKEIALVRATDKDIGENARLEYSLSQADREHFSITGINNEGSIMVYKAVDYEVEAQRFFNLTVTVKDPNPTHIDTAYVQVYVEDFNDNAPVFEETPINVVKFENISVGERLAKFHANDADSGINAQFIYRIDTSSDKRRQFAIDPSTGIVTVRRPLDRETQEVHTISIQAVDKGDPQQTGRAQLVVTLKDINDNYPIFKQDYRPIVMENEEKFPVEVIRVQAIDRDTLEFGPPFGFKSTVCADGTSRCPCPERPTCSFFNLTFNRAGDNNNGEGIVFTLTKFDREQTKYYYMPIVTWDMRDSGSPLSQTGTNTLTIEIGDINDNKHKPAHKDILVYNYKGLFGDIPIGNAYAADPDDWDVVDKTYTYVSPVEYEPFFSVVESDGTIMLKKNVLEGRYQFKVKIYDKTFDLEVESTVAVTVIELSEEAVMKSGSIRLQGITAEQFVDREKIDDGNLDTYYKSKYTKLQELLAKKIQANSVEDVQIIGVENNGDFTDVRYSAHGSPYYDASKLEAVVSLNKNEFEKELGAQIVMVPIDECRDEKFEGGCYNHLNITGYPALINTNGTSFVGVETRVEPTAGCRADTFPNSDDCTGDYCFNGGTCVKDDWGALSCTNCPTGFNGPRCQQTHHSFDGKSYSLFKPLEQCEDGQTSIEFITEQKNGLIFYNGPITELTDDDPTDYISLELSNGYPVLRIDHGTGESRLVIDGRDLKEVVRVQPLSDGKWHHIDIIRKGREVQMIVDRCQNIPRENDIAVDDKACRATDITPNENKLLNVNTLLQLGGRAETDPAFYPQGITPEKFNGCVKNLKHNGMLYNLHIGGVPGYPAGQSGCPREKEICDNPTNTRQACGENGICTSSWSPPFHTCKCKPGYRGDRCLQETSTRELLKESYLQWKVSDDLFNDITPWTLHMQMMFRTRDDNGLLMTVSTTDKHVTLEIVKGILQVRYDIGNNEKILQLINSPANNGRWHTVELERYGKQFVLKMDGGEGKNYAYTLGKPGDYESINIHRTIYAGALVTATIPIDITNDLSDTCLGDIRLENGWFPLYTSENKDSKAAELEYDVKLKDGCVREDCKGVDCKNGKVCYPLWGDYECRCPEGERENDVGVCVLIPFCEVDPCVAGECIPESRQCKCATGWTGTLCDQRDPGQIVAGLSTGAIVAIVVCIFIALILALVVIFLVRFTERPKDGDKYILEVDPDEDIRENVMNYDEEGAGEEDHAAYDMSRLRKPDDAMSMGKSPLDTIPRTRMPGLGRAPRPGEDPDVGGFIDDRLDDANDDPNAPPGDNVCEYAYEGGGSDAGSLSSLNTTSSDGDQDYDYLNDWGPKFAKLADMYGAGQED